MDIMPRIIMSCTSNHHNLMENKILSQRWQSSTFLVGIGTISSIYSNSTRTIQMSLIHKCVDTSIWCETTYGSVLLRVHTIITYGWWEETSWIDCGTWWCDRTWPQSTNQINNKDDDNDNDHNAENPGSNLTSREWTLGCGRGCSRGGN